jgi:hypothetical protein
MGEYLSFKKLISPLLIQVVFWIAVLFNTVEALFYAEGFFSGVFRLVFGPIVIRILCEALIVVFQINNTLTEIRDDQRPAAPAPVDLNPPV